MKLPETSDLLLPMLETLADGSEHHLKDLAGNLANKFEFSTNDTIKDRSLDAQFYSRIVGARTYLVQAKLLASPKRGVSMITQRGKELLAEAPQSLAIEDLTRYPEFVTYLEASATKNARDYLPAENDDQTSETNGTSGNVGFESTEMEIEIADAVRPDANGPLNEFASLNPFSDLPPDDFQPQSIHATQKFKALSIPEINAAQNDSDFPDDDPQDDKAKLSETKEVAEPVHQATPIHHGLQAVNEEAENNIQIASFLGLIEQLNNSNQLSPTSTHRSIPIIDNQTSFSPSQFTALAILRFLENWFKHFWLYLIPFVFMLIAYGASFYFLSDEFVSKGVLFVQTDTLINQVASLGDDNVEFFLSPSEQTADEITELLNTDAFIRLIISQTPLEEEMALGSKAVRDTIEDVRKAITVNITGSNNVEVSASWDDQEIAWKTATATLNSYIEWKITSDKRDSFAAREFLENLVPQYENEYRATVQSLEEYLIQFPEPFRGERPEIEQLQINQLQTATQTAFDRLQEASDNLEQIRLEEVIIEGKTSQSYTIVDRPEIPFEKEGGLLRELITAAVFIGLGVAFSLLAIVATTLFDRSVRFPIETPVVLGKPVLASVKKVNLSQETD